MFFNFILISTFYVLNNNKKNFNIFKMFLTFNFLFFFILNFKNILNSNELYLYLIIFFIIYFSNEKTIFLVFICIFIKYDNLLINLISLEIINLIFFTSCKKNTQSLKKIIIYNYLLSTFFIFIIISYFYYNYSTLNKQTLFYFDFFFLKHFLIFFLFLKMGGLIGYNLQYYFYKLLNYKNLINYTITNLYLYINILNLEYFT